MYTHDSYNSTGQRISSIGTVDGNVWTWTEIDGRSQHTNTVAGPPSFPFKTEVAQDWTARSTLAEGTTTKTN